MKLHIKTRYYSETRVGREPIKYRVRQPRGKGTDVYGEIWLDPVLRKASNSDLRQALINHELRELKAWAVGSTRAHSEARSREPTLIRRIGGVSGFWKEIKRRQRR